MTETEVETREDGHVVEIKNERVFPFRDSATITRGEAEDLRDELDAALRGDD